MALPTALLAMVASIALAGAAIVTTVNVQAGSKRDSGSKRAIAAADAGISAATTALGHHFSTGSEAPCPDGGQPVDGWCPPQTADLGGDSYAYRVSDLTQPCREFEFCVVAEGEASGVARRVLVGFEGAGTVTSPNTPPPGDPGGSGGAPAIEGLIGEDELKLDGSALVRVNVGTNGNFVTNGAAVICGNVRHGIGMSWIKSGSMQACKGTEVTEGNAKLPPVESFMPADIAENNSNYRLEKCKSTKPVKVPEGCQSDTFTGSWNGNSPWNPSTRTISTSGSNTLTLGGGDYWLCKLQMNGSNQLIMAAGARVRLFFDRPENCGLSSTAEQIVLSGANRIAATGYQPGVGSFEMPGFYLMGSESATATLNLTGATGTNEFVLYAPRTNIVFKGAVVFKGIIAGKKVTATGSAVIEHDDGFEPAPGMLPGLESDDGDPDGEPSGPVLYEPAYYVECTGAGLGGDPDANC